MPYQRMLKHCVALSVLFHLAMISLASLVPLTPTRLEEVMVVELTDVPRSTEFLKPEPGIIEGAKQAPVPPPKPAVAEKPPLPEGRILAGRVPDLPVNPALPPEKAFPPQRSKEEKPAPEADSGPAQTARAERIPERSAPAAPPEGSAPSKSLRELTPSLGKMVMARVNPDARHGQEKTSGTAVGTRGKASEKGPISEHSGGGAYFTALNAPEIQYISYFASIKRKIELVWQYPHDAIAAGIQGDLTIDFVIGRNGSLESVDLIRPSGHKILDDEAVGSIKKAAPYNPIPENYDIPNLQIRAHFIYEMTTLKIR